MVMKNQHTIHTQRICQICVFLSAGGGTLQEMHIRVNEGLEGCGLKSIGLRTLLACIGKLIEGDFLLKKLLIN